MQRIAINRIAGVPERACDRNEAVFLLDELIHRDAISRCMYKKYVDCGFNSTYHRTIPVVNKVNGEFNVERDGIDSSQQDTPHPYRTKPCSVRDVCFRTE